MKMLRKPKVTSTKRIEKNLVEPVPLREALINAIGHKRFFQRNTAGFVKFLVIAWNSHHMAGLYQARAERIFSAAAACRETGN